MWAALTVYLPLEMFQNMPKFHYTKRGFNSVLQEGTDILPDFWLCSE
jgi:hypothetical protein